MKLYHGTDARIVTMTEEQRRSHLQECESVIDTIGKIFIPYVHDTQGMLNLFQDGVDDDFINDFRYTVIHINSKAIGSKLYRYDAFYLTNNFERAIGYAKDSFAFGERGKFAYLLCKAFYNLKNRPILTQDISSSVSDVFSFATDVAKPVVFEFDGLDKKNLNEENGMPWDMIEEQLAIIPQLPFNFRYDKPLTLDLAKAHIIE